MTGVPGLFWLDNDAAMMLAVNVIMNAKLGMIIMSAAASLQVFSVLSRVGSTQQKEIAMKYTEQDGRVFVSARELENLAGIAIKPLPGRSRFAACRADRCILVDRLDQDGDAVWISLEQIADGFGARWAVDEDQHVVSIEFEGNAQLDSNSPGSGSVGALAPAMRFSLLDGDAISLDELRGKRVLINSWASW
jgi:hypothetical protein